MGGDGEASAANQQQTCESHGTHFNYAIWFKALFAICASTNSPDTLEI